MKSLVSLIKKPQLNLSLFTTEVWFSFEMDFLVLFWAELTLILVVPLSV